MVTITSHVVSKLLRKVVVSYPGHKSGYICMKPCVAQALGILLAWLIVSIGKLEASTIQYQVSCRSCEQNASVSIRLSKGQHSRFSVEGFSWSIMLSWVSPIPKNAKEVHSFSGLASYYQRFIPKFAQIAQCLHVLVGPTSNKHEKIRGQKIEKLTAIEKPNEPEEFKRISKHQQAFDALKEALVTAPVLC